MSSLLTNKRHNTMKIKTLAPNQTELTTIEGAVILFSYQTPVAALLPSGRYVRTSERYNQATTRHINKWLPDASADVEEQPESYFHSLGIDTVIETARKARDILSQID